MDDKSQTPVVAIVAVGTELTDGQITNRNASWLSQQLKKVGFATRFHLTVRDDKEQMLDFFRFAQDRADVIIVTGGLGPTSDDFTREVIAQHTACPLVWNEERWANLVARQKELRLKTRDNHRQQCFFPTGAIPLANRAGTADGFFLAHQNRPWFALPGPPAEVQAIFFDHVLPTLLQTFPIRNYEITRKWQVLGRVESELAELIATKVAPHPFEVGYRVHLPYVEIKLTHSAKDTAQAGQTITQIEQLIGGSTVLRDEESLWQKLATALQSFERVVIVDSVSGSYLRKKWCENLPAANLLANTDFLSSMPPTQSLSKKTLVIELLPLARGQAKLRLSSGGKTMVTHLTSPFYVAGLALRQTQILTEYALLKVAAKAQQWTY